MASVAACTRIERGVVGCRALSKCTKGDLCHLDWPDAARSICGKYRGGARVFRSCGGENVIRVQGVEDVNWYHYDAATERLVGIDQYAFGHPDACYGTFNPVDVNACTHVECETMFPPGASGP